MPFWFAEGIWDSLYEENAPQKRLNGRFVIGGAVSLPKVDPTPGRRFRVFSSVVTTKHTIKHTDSAVKVADAYDLLQGDPAFTDLPLRVGSGTAVYSAIPEVFATKSIKDAVLHVALQDLGWLIGWELTQACGAFDNPDLWYPGIDDGIEPVPDEHIDLVIWATTREIIREQPRLGGDRRGVPPLADLPQRIKRAFVERRRWHYQCYGIGRKEYETNCWSLWNVNEDADWVPPWIKESTT